MNRPVDRRRFLGSAARGAAGLGALAAAPAVRGFADARSPSDVVRIGVIGFGVQGLNDASAALRLDNVEVVAAASCYDGHLERARELLGEGALVTRDYRRILDRTDVDAVIVASPNHWHRQHGLDALAAGKHVYCEKPLAHTIEEGAELAAAAAKSERVFQVGSQHTSSPHVLEAKQIVLAGELGQITQIKASWDENNEISAWVKPIPPDASERTIDWPAFQGPAPRHAFDPRRVFRWRTYRDYAEGLSGDVLSHVVTAIHFLLDLDAPTYVTAVGGRLRWKDERDVYDTITGGLEYPEGIVAVLGSTQNSGYDGTEIRILGTKATLALTFAGWTLYQELGEPNWRYTTNAWPKAFREEFWRSKGLPLEAPRGGGFSRLRTKELRRYLPPEGPRRFSHHMQSFLDCIRNGKQPLQDAAMGHVASLTTHMINLAHFEKRSVRFDRQTRRVA